MGIRIEPLTQDDVPEMVRVGRAAFAYDLIAKSTFDEEKASPEEIEEFQGWRIQMMELRLSGPGKYYFKAVDEATGNIAGFVGMYSPEVQVSQGNTLQGASLPRPKFLNNKIDEELRSKLQHVEEKWMEGRKDIWYVQSMAVHPDYQGQSIARTLLQRALEEPDKAGQYVFLEGTSAAQSLYKRCGFQVVDEISLLDGQYQLSVMMRQPR